MKFSAITLALTFGTAAAFAPAAKPTTRVAPAAAAKDELIALAESSTEGLNPGFWDPLGVADIDFWGIGNDATIGYLRHAEIKHGRVAMAAFLGYCAQCTPLVRGEHSILPYKGYVPDVSPQEQWDNIPLWGKLQIFTLIGMLESYGEGADADSDYVHYCRGGKPGYYPPIKGKGAVTPVTLDLFDPFGILPAQSEEEKERGRLVEVNNGRAAMLGIGAILSASKGLIVPGIDALNIPKYDGDVMVPFSNDFSFFGHTFGRVIDWSTR